MPTPVMIDFDLLHTFDASLHSKLVVLFQKSSGVHEIDLALTPWGDRNHFVQFLEYQKAMKAEQEQKDAERQRQADADKQAGLARLVQYTKERGLLDVPSNGIAVQEWLDKNTHGYWSRNNVDAAISILGPRGTNVLLWAVPKAPEPVQVEEAPAPVRYLENGEPELPLDAGESQMRAASVVQLRDLSKRRGEGRNLRQRDGWTGASL